MALVAAVFGLAFGIDFASSKAEKLAGALPSCRPRRHHRCCAFVSSFPPEAVIKSQRGGINALHLLRPPPDGGVTKGEASPGRPALAGRSGGKAPKD
jgi:hypothetical protein